MAASVAQGGEGARIPLSGEDGFDDGLGADPVDVAEDVVEFEVHFGEDFLHAPELVGGFAHEAVAVTGEVTQGEDFLDGTEGFFQKSRGVELLQPLGVADIGLFPRNAFDVAGVDQAALDARLLEDVIAVDPVVAGAFHGDGGDAVGKEPVAQPGEIPSEGGEGADVIRTAIRRDGDDDFRSSDVDACGVRLGFDVDPVLSGAGFVFAALTVLLVL